MNHDSENICECRAVRDKQSLAKYLELYNVSKISAGVWNNFSRAQGCKSVEFYTFDFK